MSAVGGGEGDDQWKEHKRSRGFYREWRNHDPEVAINNNSHSSYFYYSGKGNG